MPIDESAVRGHEVVGLILLSIEHRHLRSSPRGVSTGRPQRPPQLLKYLVFYMFLLPDRAFTRVPNGRSKAVGALKMGAASYPILKPVLAAPCAEHARYKCPSLKARARVPPRPQRLPPALAMGAGQAENKCAPIAPVRCPLRPHIPVLTNIPCGMPNRGTSRLLAHTSQFLPR